MKKARFTETQIIGILKEANAGMAVVVVSAYPGRHFTRPRKAETAIPQLLMPLIR